MELTLKKDTEMLDESYLDLLHSLCNNNFLNLFLLLLTFTVMFMNYLLAYFVIYSRHICHNSKKPISNIQVYLILFDI